MIIEVIISVIIGGIIIWASLQLKQQLNRKSKHIPPPQPSSQKPTAFSPPIATSYDSSSPARRPATGTNPNIIGSPTGPSRHSGLGNTNSQTSVSNNTNALVSPRQEQNSHYHSRRHGNKRRSGTIDESWDPYHNHEDPNSSNNTNLSGSTNRGSRSGSVSEREKEMADKLASLAITPPSKPPSQYPRAATTKNQSYPNELTNPTNRSSQSGNNNNGARTSVTAATPVSQAPTVQISNNEAKK